MRVIVALFLTLLTLSGLAYIVIERSRLAPSQEVLAARREATQVRQEIARVSADQLGVMDEYVGSLGTADDGTPFLEVKDSFHAMGFDQKVKVCQTAWAVVDSAGTADRLLLVGYLTHHVIGEYANGELTLH